MVGGSELCQDVGCIGSRINCKRNQPDVRLTLRQPLDILHLMAHAEALRPAARENKADDTKLFVQYGALDRTARPLGENEFPQSPGPIRRYHQFVIVAHPGEPGFHDRSSDDQSDETQDDVHDDTDRPTFRAIGLRIVVRNDGHVAGFTGCTFGKAHVNGSQANELLQVLRARYSWCLTRLGLLW